MPEYLAAFALVLLMGMVLARTLLLRRAGVQAMAFGRIDRTDFLILPFALFYVYTVLARAFGWPLVSQGMLYQSAALGWVGVGLCFLGLLGVLLSLLAFGNSFRIGIDRDQPADLVTTGVFSLSRNPIYVGFLLVLLGQFLVFPNWVLLVYLGAGAWVIHRQVLREEAFLRQAYGPAYADYCARVRRYV